MTTIMIIVFVLGYMAIALEHPIKVDKAASALIIGGLSWALFAFTGINHHDLTHEIQHHIVAIAEILFFLLGAMTIVELIDAHEGFSIITDKITTNKKVALIWILSFITFFFSAALDNLTTAIVMAALLPKLIKDKEDLWMFAGMVILSANAGGAWSPIGDVTTIMLWIGGQVTASNIITSVFIPSLVCALVPLIYLSFRLKGSVTRPEETELKEHHINPTTAFERNLIFYLGVAGLLFVPIFKTITHLPPYIGMLLSLGILWLITEIIHRSKNHEQKSQLSVIGVLKKVDTPTIFFFLGILLAVAALQSAGQLDIVAKYLQRTFNGDIYIINIIIGLLSSIVDNVPLVAGAMGMYDIGPVADGVLAFPQDHAFWEFLAYCAGTGGSVLIIGSAAGVALMGILKIDFIWYLKNISLLALMGYLAGAATYILMQ
ncbi:MAG: sodium:proton antiporter NhaD [Flavobacteriales bacterium]|nr:sodium:proton antiporter NhaD [Flavobacteriales bacterium]MBT6013483.1 sodium:proton antiporter NhaD [Flavobacteriales bacterium]